MCLGNPETKADLLFNLVIGQNYQAEIDRLIETGKYSSEEKAKLDLQVGWTSSTLEHAVH